MLSASVADVFRRILGCFRFSNFCCYTVYFVLAALVDEKQFEIFLSQLFASGRFLPSTLNRSAHLFRTALSHFCFWFLTQPNTRK